MNTMNKSPNGFSLVMGVLYNDGTNNSRDDVKRDFPAVAVIKYNAMCLHDGKSFLSTHLFTKACKIDLNVESAQIERTERCLTHSCHGEDSANAFSVSSGFDMPP